jgi:hypothetical protein
LLFFSHLHHTDPRMMRRIHHHPDSKSQLYCNPVQFTQPHDPKRRGLRRKKAKRPRSPSHVASILPLPLPLPLPPNPAIERQR